MEEVFGLPEVPDERIPTVRRTWDDAPFWLFENREVPVSEQYGLFFEHELPPLRSRLVAWLLALVLGFTGADRFYLRKPVTGTLKLLTLGGAGIWWARDLLRITRTGASDGRRLPLAGSAAVRRRLRVASAAVIAAVLGLAAGAALPPVTAAATQAYDTVHAVFYPPPPPPVPAWVTVADASAAKPPAPVTTVTGKLHVTYSFPGAAVVYLQPAKGPATTIITLAKPGAAAIGVSVPPGTYTLTVSASGPGWSLKAEELRLPG